ncbi:DUF2865 domain-containing protein [Bradyrhizobium sp.]|uniref:DUF2865 domain-containing protein n=1 Tax=Bradyrhizobium sp. TaxID=376 RepID=UPI001D2A94C6|nr:DUF2865 domain-containing protein [Bradyrhizobium sp.]MBI5319048.1 DUF2865 domain-containing protein [Bradyrhizobium sp.]
MLHRLTNPLSRWLLACAVLAAPLALSTDGLAQMQPGGPPQQAGPPGATGNPICQRLEMQLATIDRGTGSGDPAKDEQIRRYQEAQARQQGELDRVTSQAKRMGCDSSGFFSLFNQQSAQCGPVNNQIQQMRGNLDQITTSLERLRSGGLGGADRENQRRSVMTALAQNNCGPQYAAAAREQGPGGFLGGLFGNNAPSMPGGDLGSMSGTYRTVCVRTCDGAYFPVSFATVPARFPDDEKTCKALCPATEATLYAHRNPGEDMNQAVSTAGQLYTALPTAFKFRAEFTPGCSCKAAGQTWSDALKSVDDKAMLEQQGDIIVTEESAKKMQQQKMQAQQPKGAQPAAGKKGQPAPATTASAPPAAAPSPPADGKDKPIRSVGPTFIPNNNTTTR